MNQLTARIVAPQNEYANADLANGTYGFTPIWGFGGALPTVSLVNSGEAIRALKNGGAFDGSMTRYGIVALDGGGVSKSAGGAPARKMWPVASGERIGFAVDGRTRAGSARWYLDVRWYDKNGAGSTSLGTAETTHGNTAWQRIGVVNSVPGDGYVWAEATIVLGWDGSLGTADMELRRPTFARLASTATALPAFSAPPGGGQIQALSASVTQQSLAIIDLENQQALAMWQVKTAASGGKPTVLSLISSSFGSAIAMAAEQIYFGDNTVFDDASDQLRTVTNGVRRVIAWGAAFGSGADAGQLTEWEGPDSVALNAMTRANATFFRANTAPYVGGSGLNAGVFSAQANLATAVGSRTSAGQVTTATVSLTVSGNTGTLTYAWTQISGNEDWTIVTPSGSSTAFRVNVATPGEQKRATFACRISDIGTGKTITVIVGGVAIYNV